HAQPDADAEREQALLGSADQLPQRLLHPHRQHDFLDARLRERYVPIHGGSLLRSWTDRLERSQQQRTRPEGPPSSSTSYGTTSFFGPLGVTNIRTFVDPQSPVRVGVLMDVADMDAIMAAMETAAAAEAMAYDGVLPETLV